MQMRLDRFTLKNSRRCFIELGSEQQAKMAVNELNNAQLLDEEIIVKPLKDDFVWGFVSEKSNDLGESRYFDQNTKTVSEAVKPLLESRRMMLSVQTPGWGEKHSTVGHNKIAWDIIERYLGEYGIEAVGDLQPFFGDMQLVPRMLCFVDFKTKAGADQAVQAIHDTEIEGRKVWLKESVLAPWRAHHIGKVDPSVLATLQEKGLAPMETFENLKKHKKKGGKKRATAPSEVENTV
jgi:RNA recognition motif-containing protein